MSHRPLLLFDIDGTLLWGGTRVHRDAFAHAFQAVYGLPLSLDGIQASGRTDSWLLAEPLRRHGLAAEIIVASQLRAFEVMHEYARMHMDDLREFVLPGVPELLDELHRHEVTLGLLTGNLREIAFLKLKAAGLGSYFAVGGFGGESEVRSHLVPVALREGAGESRDFPAGRAAIIGDTPLDIEAGRAHGTSTVGVATGHFNETDLREAGADLVLSSFQDWKYAVDALLALF